MASESSAVNSSNFFENSSVLNSYFQQLSSGDGNSSEVSQTTNSTSGMSGSSSSASNAARLQSCGSSSSSNITGVSSTSSNGSQWNDISSSSSHIRSSHQNSHSNPHHHNLGLVPNISTASTTNTHSIFGTGNFHYKTNNSWPVPTLSCYQRIYSDHNNYNRSSNSNSTNNSLSSDIGSQPTPPTPTENILVNQLHHHQHHHHITNNNKRYHHTISGKSGNNKDICGDDKFKEDGDPWSVEAQAAFLGPILWDKTLPYDNDLKVPQYEDLDEFLSENNMPDGLPGTHLGHSAGLSHRSDSLGHSAGLSLGLGHVTTKRERSPSPSDCISPDTLNPPSPAESTFSFASSGRDFDPRTRAFSDEELKPQPMIKKSRKQFVPDELKDDKYWARRRKNNIAAKRSRDARRQKENQIAMRARYLEKENATLHQEVEQLKQENMDLRARLAKFQDV